MDIALRSRRTETKNWASLSTSSNAVPPLLSSGTQGSFLYSVLVMMRARLAPSAGGGDVCDHSETALPTRMVAHHISTSERRMGSLQFVRYIKLFAAIVLLSYYFPTKFDSLNSLVFAVIDQPDRTAGVIGPRHLEH